MLEWPEAYLLNCNSKKDLQKQDEALKFSKIRIFSQSMFVVPVQGHAAKIDGKSIPLCEFTSIG